MNSFKLVISIVLLLCSAITADDTDFVQMDDGPYIFLEGDNAPFAIKMCDNIIDSIGLADTRSVTFEGICNLGQLSVKVNLGEKYHSVAYDTASKFFAISDFHGEYENMVELLTVNKIITDNLNWSFGNGRLVVVGDMMDRGDKVTEILWLIYKLEKEAEAAGGKVHFLLGNHEFMVMQGDLRYIHKKYDSVAVLMNRPFDQFFAKGTVLGDWLRSKKVMLKMNDILFVHGGLSPHVKESGMRLEELNRIMIANLDQPKDKRKSDSLLSLVYGSFGPIWYRGYVTDMEKYSKITENGLDSILSEFDISKIVVGHCVMDSISSHYNEKVYTINIDYYNRDAYEGLFWENGQFEVWNINGKRRIIKQ